jgi:hypothetical protein
MSKANTVQHVSFPRLLLISPSDSNASPFTSKFFIISIRRVSFRVVFFFLPSYIIWLFFDVTLLVISKGDAERIYTVYVYVCDVCAVCGIYLHEMIRFLFVNIQGSPLFSPWQLCNEGCCTAAGTTRDLASGSLTAASGAHNKSTG